MHAINAVRCPIEAAARNNMLAAALQAEKVRMWRHAMQPLTARLLLSQQSCCAGSNLATMRKVKHAC